MASLKDQIKSLQDSSNPLLKGVHLIALVSWRCTVIPIRLIFSADHRSLLALKLFHNEHAHQISNYTELDRYPELFETCKRWVKDSNNLKILSFGCSSGEEVFTLRKYFPNAYIVGVDINKRNIKKAVRQNKDPEIVFSYDIENTLKKHGPFNLIFALAVLQRSANKDVKISDSSKIYPFEKFNAKIQQLDSHLKPKGMFVLDHADYLFEEANVASDYHALKGSHNIIRERHLFDRNNKKMPEHAMHHRVFIKK